MVKKPRQLEKIIKGFDNHRRIQILELLAKEPELSLFEIADELDADFRVIHEHVRRMVSAGLVLKRREKFSVRHTLSNRGKRVLSFIRNLE